ncbi:hypothetical protein PF008_g19847 [Phytophthora fragariae]|uniref:RxLR effector protein n=1 Tax=Phytophthora fragariae TaxID=53985 RepID=A0A6G0R176_9STRA|nr:hypothetical protein PF008_g19847 [Phytophthora fragariae]
MFIVSLSCLLAAYAELQVQNQAEGKDITRPLNNFDPHFGEDTNSELFSEADDSTGDYGEFKNDTHFNILSNVMIY